MDRSQYRLVVAAVCLALVAMSVGSGLAAAQQVNGSNATTTTAGGPASRLSQLEENTTNGTGNATNSSGNVVPFAKSLRQTNTSHAKTLVRENPSKAARIVETVGNEYPGNTSAQLRSNPKQVAGLYLGLVGPSRPGRGGNSGGGGCSVGNPAACIPGPGEVLRGFMSAIGNSLANQLKPIVQGFDELFLGVSAPGTTDPTTWVTPEDGWWGGIYTAYYIFAALALMALVPVGMHRFQIQDRYRREKELRELAWHVAMILLGAVLVIPLSLHTFDVVATALSPNASEFFATPGDFAKLGLGWLVGTGLTITQSGLVLWGVAVLLMVHVAVSLLAAMWPWFWVADLVPISPIEWFGKAGIASFFGLGFMRMLQAALLRVFFSLNWNPMTAGVASAFGAVVMTIVGLIFVFVFLPLEFKDKAVPMATLASGGSRAMKKAPDRYKNSRDRIGNVQQRMQDVRGHVASYRSSTDGGSTESGSSSLPRGGTGSVGSTVSNSDHREGGDGMPSTGRVGGRAASWNHRGDTARRAGEVTNDKLRGGVDAAQVERKRRSIRGD